MRLLYILLITVICAYTKDVMDGTKKLLLSQIMWRHGDRSPTETYKNDIYQEDTWRFGGGGWGQLSPTGMTQHLNLGKRLRKRYVDTGFLSNTYNSQEIYVRSTDVNRTIISAMSNLMGMYSQQNSQNRAGIDFPSSPDWPNGFVPIAVHTVDEDTDHIGNPDAKCLRQTKLWQMAKKSPEVENLQSLTWVKDLLSNLTRDCGGTVDIDNLWIIAGAFLIENTYGLQQPSWYSDTLFHQTSIVNDQMQLYNNGVFDQPLIMDGVDVGSELKTIRGGSMVNDINMHMNIKIDCIGNSSAGCKWINNLKYYAYSAHDTTLYAFFSCFGIQSKVVLPHGYPHYSAAILVELWQDTVTQIPYFKMLYHDKAGDDFSPVTRYIEGCSEDYCSLDVYRKIAASVEPPKDLKTWCDEDPTTFSNNLETSEKVNR